MDAEKRVFIAGAGPVGLTAAACLVAKGVPVTVFEAEPELSTQSRASTFHPPTLDMLDDLGLAQPLIAEGLITPSVQYRATGDGLLGSFDFGLIADLTRHPYRVQSEQFKLTRIIAAKLHGSPLFELVFGQTMQAVEQRKGGVTVTLSGAAGDERRSGLWLIGADGARSQTRRALGIGFDGFTWPERFLVVTTPYDFDSVIAGLASVTYFADPVQWYFLLRVPGAWRVMVPVPETLSDEAATAKRYASEVLQRIVPGLTNFEIWHTTLYRVHQRVAATFRSGRAFLAGDAAHINNPLGGMGMNGGIHDAVNLCGRLAKVWHGEAEDGELDLYARQRRNITLENVQTATIQNKRNLEARDAADRARFRDEMRAAAADPVLARSLLIKLSMIASLRRAEELG